MKIRAHVVYTLVWGKQITLEKQNHATSSKTSINWAHDRVFELALKRSRNDAEAIPVKEIETKWIEEESRFITTAYDENYNLSPFSVIYTEPKQ